MISILTAEARMINLYHLGQSGSEMAQCIWDCEDAEQLDLLFSTLDRQEAAWAEFIVSAMRAGGDDITPTASVKNMLDRLRA
jgi:hypothetical protein